MLKQSTRNLITGLGREKRFFPHLAGKRTAARNKAAKIMQGRAAKDAVRKMFRD